MQQVRPSHALKPHDSDARARHLSSIPWQLSDKGIDTSGLFWKSIFSLAALVDHQQNVSRARALGRDKINPDSPRVQVVSRGGDGNVLQMYLPKCIHGAVSLGFVLFGAVVKCSSIAWLSGGIYHRVAQPLLLVLFAGRKGQLALPGACPSPAISLGATICPMNVVACFLLGGILAVQIICGCSQSRSLLSISPWCHTHGRGIKIKTRGEGLLGPSQPVWGC